MAVKPIKKKTNILVAVGGAVLGIGAAVVTFLGVRRMLKKKQAQAQAPAPVKKQAKQKPKKAKKKK